MQIITLCYSGASPQTPFCQIPKSLFKIFSFIEASSPYEAFKKWKEDVKDDILLFEDIVTIVEISDKKYYFNLEEN